MTRIIAIDWSGAKSGASSKIWLAEVRNSRLVRLESGRGRHEVVSDLICEAARDPDLVVGLDFAFSFPAWYAKRLETVCVEGLWDTVREQGEEWLDRCREPFWGGPGRPRPDLHQHFRQTENEVAECNDARPKSVFQIGGAGAVGTGSIRGMPYLPKLRDNGFSIWPFHVCEFPLLIEIYPRLLTGPVNKANFDERETYLAHHCPEIGDTFACKAASSEDAFDAAVSAVVMSRHLNEISTLAKSQDSIHLIEGKIWWPQNREAASKSLQTSKRSADCPFCDIHKGRIVAKSKYALAVKDRYPVSRGHTLVVPKAHAECLFTASAGVQADIWRLVTETRADIESRLCPDGFNVGINDGRAAGQTVGHAHIHIIPRFHDDVADPRGGIRWVLPERAVYWDP